MFKWCKVNVTYYYVTFFTVPVQLQMKAHSMYASCQKARKNKEKNNSTNYTFLYSKILTHLYAPCSLKLLLPLIVCISHSAVIDYGSRSDLRSASDTDLLRSKWCL